MAKASSVSGLAIAFISVVGIAMNTVNAQENAARLDSINRLLDPAKKDTVQLQLLTQACESWYTSNNAFPYLERLGDLSQALAQSDVPQIKKRAIRARGAFHFFTGYHAKFARNIPLALRSFNEALRDFEQAQGLHAVGETHDALGVLYRAVGASDQAIVAFRKERVVAQKLTDDHLNIQALVHLAASMTDQGKHALAITYLDSCGRGTPADSSAVLVERARITELMGDSERAIQLLRAALHYAGRSVNPWDRLPVLAPLARLYYDLGLYPEGVTAAKECVQVSHAMGDQTAHCTCVALLGQGELANGAPDEAEKQWLKGLHLAQEIGNIGAARELGDEGSVVHISDLLKKLYNAQGRTKEALGMAELWIMANDSVQRMAGQDVILKAEFLHEFLKDSLDHMNELQTSTKEHYQTLTAERRHRNIILFIGVAVFGIAVVLWGRARLLSKSNAAILLAQEKLVHSEKQREALEVRTRIARDVHDQLGSDLTKLALLSGEAKAMAKQDPGSIPLVADNMERLAGEANRSLGDIVWAIDPHHDSLAGLTERVRAHCEHMLKGSSIPYVIDCRHTGNDRTLDPATKRDLYMIVRESLNNAVKHSLSTHIAIAFHTDLKRVYFAVQDNGIGFDLNSTGGHGLMNIKVRAQGIGADLNVESNNGTTIRLTLVLR